MEVSSPKESRSEGIRKHMLIDVATYCVSFVPESKQYHDIRSTSGLLAFNHVKDIIC